MIFSCGLVDEAPVAHLFMHAADHDLGPKNRTCRYRRQRLVHLLLRAYTAGEGGEAVIVIPACFSAPSAHRAANPVERIFQHTGHAMIVFGRDHDHAIARVDGQT